jgi:HlyD family secretion protein
MPTPGRRSRPATPSSPSQTSPACVATEAHEFDAGSVKLGAPVTITSDGYPGHSWRGRVEEVPDSVTPRRLKPQDPARPTDTRVLAVKVAFSEPNPLKLGASVDLSIQATP